MGGRLEEKRKLRGGIVCRVKDEFKKLMPFRNGKDSGPSDHKQKCCRLELSRSAVV